MSYGGDTDYTMIKSSSLFHLRNTNISLAYLSLFPAPKITETEQLWDFLHPVRSDKLKKKGSKITASKDRQTNSDIIKNYCENTVKNTTETS